MASLCFDSSCEATWFGALTYGGLPITTSKPPFSKTCGNSFCQSKALAPATAGSLMSELPHLMFWFSEFNLRWGLAVRSQSASWAMPTLSSLISTP